MNNAPDWLLFAVPVFFVVMWTAGLNLAARMGGWSRLAKEYRWREPFDGFKKRFVSGEMAGRAGFAFPCNYGLCLIAGSNPHGLYLAVLWPFRPGHPPILIPWSDIKPRIERRLFGEAAIFAFERVAPIRLRVSGRLARQLVENAGSAEIEPLDQPA